MPTVLLAKKLTKVKVKGSTVQGNSTQKSKSRSRKLAALVLKLSHKVDKMEINLTKKFEYLYQNVQALDISQNRSSLIKEIEPRLINLHDRMRETMIELETTIAICHKPNQVHEINVPETVTKNVPSKVDASCGSDEPLNGPFAVSVETQTSKSRELSLRQKEVTVSIDLEYDDDVFQNIPEDQEKNARAKKLSIGKLTVEEEVFKSRARIPRSPFKSQNDTRTELISTTIKSVSPQVPNNKRSIRDRECSFISMSSTPPKKAKMTRTNHKTNDSCRKLPSYNCHLTSTLTPRDSLPMGDKTFSYPIGSKATKNRILNANSTFEGSDQGGTKEMDQNATFNADLQGTPSGIRKPSSIAALGVSKSRQKSSTNSPIAETEVQTVQETFVDAKPNPRTKIKKVVKESSRRVLRSDTKRKAQEKPAV